VNDILSRTRSGSVAALGEAALIGRLRLWLGRAAPDAPHGIGDDCAVLPPIRGAGLITVDPLVFGIHFDGRVPPFAAGAKLVKRNLSDIAAMGGRPKAAVIALAMDPRVSVHWLRSFYRGAAAESLRHHLPIVGGDVTRLQSGFVATLTLLGESAGRVLTRTGARAGDRLYVTGTLGRSLATGHHHRFQPRLKEGRWLAARRAVRSMMDVSDGLAKDLRALEPRGAEARVAAAALPRRDGAGVVEALCDGEDYELVFSLAARADTGSFERAWRRAFPRVRLSRIGRFARRGSPMEAGERPLNSLRGYEHLR
jgi:thiamine-monophosphate kinase